MLSCQREKFLLQRKYAYINCAYMAPLMKKVENAGKKGIKMKRKPYKVTPEDFFRDSETLRMLFAKLIHAEDAHRCVIVPSVSYGMANVVANLPRKGKIVVAEGQFPSNVYPWLSLEKDGYTVQVVEAPAKAVKGKEWNARILKALTPDTVMLAIGHVHWADGTLFDLKKFRKKLDELDALLVVDGTQSVGALPFSVQDIRPDALVCAGYKWLMGPYSIGMAYYGPRFDGGHPIEENWINRLHSENFAGLVNYQPEYQPGALRYEVGEHSNFILVPMLIAAIKQLLQWTPEAIQEYCERLFAPVMEEIKDLGYGIEDEAYRGRHLFGLQLPAGTDATQALSVFKQKRVSVSMRGESTVRLAPHVYNDETDIRKLMSALRLIAGKTD